MREYQIGKISKQQGLGMVGWLVIVLICGLTFSQVLKLFPAYLENWGLSGELKKMAELPNGVESLSVSEIKKRMQNYYLVNRVSTEAKKSLTIRRDEGRLIVEMPYERRVHMFWNIDVVLDFHLQLDSKFPNVCCKARETEH
ncbi:DUF4845 domain-containing protein [Halioxenophilus sp. WMMB6]|uniref:DUF4845 domain-containing protein n=1 Tax=Halioxenophilus sp. WMMB6 TaxID=3073815 RepID=UPI00295F55E5|nr:DUF4845 domain-containing protein [Halioxenophilus sp. WMMB6]